MAGDSIQISTNQRAAEFAVSVRSVPLVRMTSWHSLCGT